MAHELEPVVGRWYRQLDKGIDFEVMSLNEDDSSVGILYFDGDAEEMDIDAWYHMDLERTEAPEGWVSPLENDEVSHAEVDADDEWVQPLDEYQALEEEGEEGAYRHTGLSDEWDVGDTEVDERPRRGRH